MKEASVVRRLDEHGQAICEHCGAKTNKHYAAHKNLPCWNCGRIMLPPRAPELDRDAARFGKRDLRDERAEEAAERDEYRSRRYERREY
jgi:hypothetical protein